VVGEHQLTAQPLGFVNYIVGDVQRRQNFGDRDVPAARTDPAVVVALL
jgi:hypothetical protein